MKTKKIESKAFLCEYFHIPRTFKTQWCIVEEIIEGKQYLRLGLWIKDTPLYLDVAQRRFFTRGQRKKSLRLIHPAKRICYGETWDFVGLYRHKHIEVPKTYIADIYYPAIYSETLLHDNLY